jgi:phosphonatase-like hydrolase
LVTRFSLACLDMAGTTVRDDGLVERAFTAAVAALGVADDSDEYQTMIGIVRDTMGQSKIEVFRRLFGSDEAAHRANASFESAYADLVRGGAVTALPGAAEVLATLRASGIKVALTTGFAKATQESIVDALRWRDAVDLLVCPGGAVRGRPHPDMVEHAAKQLAVADMGGVVVVGDTPSDIASGLAARAGLVLGVRTGAFETAALTTAGASAVLDSIADLPRVLLLDV